MKLSFLSIFITFAITSSVTAKTPNEYFHESKENLCSPFFDRKITDAIHYCGELMLQDSEKKLKQRNAEITTELKKWNQKRMMKLFIKEQKSWERYKYARCHYASLGIKKENEVYQSNTNICNAIENYRRLETLEQEPYIS